MSKDDITMLQIQIDDVIRERDDAFNKLEVVKTECASLRTTNAQLKAAASEDENLKSLNAILSARINELEVKIKSGVLRPLTPQAKGAYHATYEFAKIFKDAVDDPNLLQVHPNLVFDTTNLPKKEGIKAMEEDWSKKASRIMAQAFQMELKIAGEVVRIREQALKENPEVAKLFEKAPDYVWFE